MHPQLLVIARAGLSVGVLLATVRVPFVRWVPLAAIIAIVAIGAVFAVAYTEAGLWDAIVFVATTLGSSALYAAAVWRRFAAIPGTYWQYVGWDLFRPAYLRASYRQVGAHELDEADAP